MGAVLSACVAPGGRHLLSASIQGNPDSVREVRLPAKRHRQHDMCRSSLQPYSCSCAMSMTEDASDYLTDGFVLLDRGRAGRMRPQLQVPGICQTSILPCGLSPGQVLEVKPELANYTFFNNHHNVMHHAAGTCHQPAAAGISSQCCFPPAPPLLLGACARLLRLKQQLHSYTAQEESMFGLQQLAACPQAARWAES